MYLTVTPFRAVCFSLGMFLGALSAAYGADHGQGVDHHPPSWSHGKGHRPQVQPERRVERLDSEFRHRACDVARGSTTLFTIADCQYAVTVLGNCMDKREAVLVVGMLPPPARYSGFQTYVFSRADKLDTSDPMYLATQFDQGMHDLLFSVVPANKSRVLVNPVAIILDRSWLSASR
jgi:hypothetical protein